MSVPGICGLNFQGWTLRFVNFETISVIVLYLLDFVLGVQLQPGQFTAGQAYAYRSFVHSFTVTVEKSYLLLWTSWHRLTWHRPLQRLTTRQQAAFPSARKLGRELKVNHLRNETESHILVTTLTSTTTTTRSTLSLNFITSSLTRGRRSMS